MTHRIEFLFDFGSPTTYLAHKRMPALVARTGAEGDAALSALAGWPAARASLPLFVTRVILPD